MIEPTLEDWLVEHPPDDHRFTQSLAGVARRVRTGEGFRIAIREFLDEFRLRAGRDLRAHALCEEPLPTGDPRQDGYLGALAEHLAAIDGLERPSWAVEPSRFLDRFWFPSDMVGFRALAVAESPAAFRRRGIFIARGSLDRR